jgi:hypothetical protein
MENQEKESVKILRECIDLQLRKASDYQSDVSTVKQAMYYPRGVESIYDMMNTKMLRIRSLLDKAAAGHDNPNFETLEDTTKDLINYASFMGSWLRYGIDGQELQKNMFNKTYADYKKKENTIKFEKDEEPIHPNRY